MCTTFVPLCVSACVRYCFPLPCYFCVPACVRYVFFECSFEWFARLITPLCRRRFRATLVRFFLSGVCFRMARTLKTPLRGRRPRAPTLSFFFFELLAEGLYTMGRGCIGVSLVVWGFVKGSTVYQSRRRLHWLPTLVFLFFLGISTIIYFGLSAVRLLRGVGRRVFIRKAVHQAFPALFHHLFFFVDNSK